MALPMLKDGFVILGFGEGGRADAGPGREKELVARVGSAERAR